MRDYATVVVLAILGVAIVLVAPILGALFGALSGWIVGWFFDETILGTLARFGANTEGLAMWQLGCMLGFVGGFFKSSSNSSKD